MSQKRQVLIEKMFDTKFAMQVDIKITLFMSS